MKIYAIELFAVHLLLVALSYNQASLLMQEEGAGGPGSRWALSAAAAATGVEWSLALTEGLYDRPPEGGAANGEVLPDVRTRRFLASYGSTIRRNASRYELDWRFLLALIRQESGFCETALSERGAGGLMQLMPATERQVAGLLGKPGLSRPHDNIVGGSYYLSYLYRLFDGVMPEDRLSFALAAYNAGPKRIYDAQELAAYLGENPGSWRAVEQAMPLLSQRYYTLHRLVWTEGKPSCGYFGKSAQTRTYVHRVAESYREYRRYLAP